MFSVRFTSFVILLIFSQIISAVEIYQTPPEEIFLKNVYTTDEGLPQNTVTSIIQTKDGYVWLATFGGLARFDGVKFTVFTTSNTPELVNNRITALYEDENQVLWIGSEDGDLVNFQNGIFTLVKKSVGAPIDKPINKLYVDQNNILWMGIEGEIRTFNIKTNEFTAYLPESFLKKPQDVNSQKDPQKFGVNDFETDSEGTLWMATTYGLISYKNNKFTNITTDEGLPSLRVRWLTVNPNGGLWINVDGQTVGKFQNNVFTPVVTLENRFEATDLEVNDENQLVFFSDGKFYKITENKVQIDELKQAGLLGAKSFLLDREENLWLGTANNLVKLKKRNVKTFAVLDNNFSQPTTAIVETSDKSVWIASTPHLMRWKDGVFELVSKSFPPKSQGNGYDILSLAAGKDNTLYFNSIRGIYQIKDGQVSLVQGTDTFYFPNLFVDRDGKLWASERNGGFYQMVNGEYKKFTIRDGLANNWVSVFFQDSKGVMWLGTKGGVSRFENGEFTNYTSQDGLKNENVRDIYEDENGAIWIGTYGGGISRLKDGKIVSIVSQNGLAENIVSRILTDENGNFWIMGNQGVFTVSRASLDAFADGKISKVYCTVYDEKDGMEVGEGNGGNMYAGWKTSDGRFWFPMIRGGIIIESGKAKQFAPPTYIESLSLESQPVNLSQKLELQPNQDNLEIAYTAVSFVKPEQIQFRYKLQGFDTDWQDVGTRRAAYYPYLPPGTYKFIVSATNGNGVWSENEAGLDIVVYAPFWRTWWFLALSVLALVGLIVFAYQKRLQTLKRRRLQQEEFSRKLINAHETERSRIAGDLHDSLGQNLLIIKNWSLLLLRNMPDKSKYRRQLEEISDVASMSLDETRTISRNLRPQHLQRFGLTETIRSMIKQIGDSTGIKFKAEIEDVDNLFSAEEELSIYRIIQESLNNIVKHSETKKVEIDIKKIAGSLDRTNAQDRVFFRIKDFGRGFDIQSKKKTSFGLDNIEQRAQLLGGTYSIKSTAGEGTEINIYLTFKEQK